MTTTNQPTILKHVLILDDALTKIGSTGIVTSPGYGTTNYPNNVDIVHVFLSPPGSGIRIQFTVSTRPRPRLFFADCGLATIY